MSEHNDYFEHHSKLLKSLYQHCQQQLPFCDERANDVDVEFLLLLKNISEAACSNEDFQAHGQAIITRIVSQYPHITPEVNRDLFWFFGGECLHFMADEELQRYQRLDELLHEPAETRLTYAQAKARVMQLH